MQFTIPASTRRRYWPLVSLVLLWLLLALLRFVLTSQSPLMRSDCASCLALSSIRHDLLLLAALALIAAAASSVGRWLIALLVLLQLALLAIIAGDLISLELSGARLAITDLSKLIENPWLVNHYLVSHRYSAGFYIAGTVLTVSWAAHWWSMLGHARQAGGRLFAAMAFLAGLLMLLPDRFSHPLPWSYRNLLQVNLPGGVDTPYSAEFVDTLGVAEVAAGAVCEPGRATGQDVIIVQLASWSWYHSAKLPGGMNVTPKLDALMDQYTWWAALFANGFSADQTRIALLTGRDPLPAVNRYRSQSIFSGYEFDPDSLPRRLHADGYRLAFFGPQSKAVTSHYDWLQEIGVDHIDLMSAEGASVEDRLHDSDVYADFLGWLGNSHPVGEPFVALLETATTQSPFIDPVTNRQDEATAFAAADQSFSEFYETLQRVDYFDRGIVIVTANQRALTPLRRSEVDAFGDSAAARVPMLVIGREFAGRGQIVTPAQLKDFPVSLDRLLSGQSCASVNTGDVFADVFDGEPQAPRCITHIQGNRRDVLQVFCGDQYGEIILDGDKTRVLRGDIPDADRLIERINRQRIKLGQLQPDLAIDH